MLVRPAVRAAQPRGGAKFDAEEFQETLARLLDGVTSAEEWGRHGRFALFWSQFQNAFCSSSGAADRACLARSATAGDRGERGDGELRASTDLASIWWTPSLQAVPFLDPASTVEIDGHRYTGRGALINADLAAGSDPVPILVHSPRRTFPVAIPAHELAALAPARVKVVRG
jgi:hypothetical protein